MIKVGKYKNWKEICEAMEWKTTGGTYKIARIKELESLCKLHREGNSWIIDEIYENKLEIVDLRKNGNNTVFRTDIQKLIIDMCSCDEIEAYDEYDYEKKVIYMSATRMMLRFNMINENYITGRNNMSALSQSRKIPIETIYDFYDSTFSNAKQNIVRALNDLQNKFLIKYKIDIMLILEDGSSRIADNIDIILITKAESEVSEEMGIKSKRELFLKRRWDEFKRRVSCRLNNKSDIVGYYNVFTIYTGDKFRKIILEHEQRIEINERLNKSMIESTLNSAKKRHEKSLSNKKYISIDKYKNMQTNDYILQSEELLGIIIDKLSKDRLEDELKNITGKYTYKDKEDSYIFDIDLSTINL